MELSYRVRDIKESITLKLNAKAMELAESGRHIFNLTAGQLPFRPLNEFVDLIRSELNFVRSYQYSPVAGFQDLRQKIMNYVQKSRGINFKDHDIEFSCMVSNGAKHCLSNVLGALIEPGDEIIILAPYWVSYPQMVKFCRGVPITISSNIFDVFIPSLEEIKRAISSKTKAIIINSPNNPTGTHYSDSWMKGFGELMLENPHVNIISDEIYYELFYFDPRPTYFYHHFPQLLSRTVIVDGISKTLASTGLRIGYTVGPKDLIDVLTKLQGQTTSGANSLIQRALVHFDFDMVAEYLGPIKGHLRSNAQIVRENYRDYNLAHCWYQPFSAFYYMVDFTRTPLMNDYRKGPDDKEDYADQICLDFLEKYGVAMVPGGDFGMPNAARISLVLEKEQFAEAMKIIVSALAKKL